MKAAGAEAESASICSRPEDKGWIETELKHHFLLRFRSKTHCIVPDSSFVSAQHQWNWTSTAYISVHFPGTSPPRTFLVISYHVCALPALIMFSDRPADLFHCTQNFIKTHANGRAPCSGKVVEPDIQFVLIIGKVPSRCGYARLPYTAALSTIRAREEPESDSSQRTHACVLNGLAAVLSVCDFPLLSMSGFAKISVHRTHLTQVLLSSMPAGERSVSAHMPFWDR